MTAAPTGYPTVTVQVGFASNPAVDPSLQVWTDISEYVMGFSTQRGRTDELQHFDAGRLTVQLDNQDGRFDPTNTSSPYYPNVVPMKMIQVLATWSATQYALFTGYVDGWPQDWALNKQERLAVTATDGFKVLGLYYYRNDTQPQETISTRCSTITAAAGIATIHNASTTVVAGEAIQSYALAHLQILEETEFGALYMTPDGFVFFEERHYRANTKTSIVATFGDGDSGGELPYERLEPAFDDTQIVNDAVIGASKATTPLATSAEYTDATSVTAYMKRSLARDLVVADSNEAADMAYALVQRFKTPAMRFRTLEILPPVQGTTLWPQALGLLISDLIRVIRRTPGGVTIDQQVHVDSIAHAWDAESGEWRTTFGLCPKALAFSHWVLDSGSFSQLDSTTILNY